MQLSLLFDPAKLLVELNQRPLPHSRAHHCFIAALYEMDDLNERRILRARWETLVTAIAHFEQAHSRFTYDLALVEHADASIRAKVLWLHSEFGWARDGRAWRGVVAALCQFLEVQCWAHYDGQHRQYVLPLHARYYHFVDLLLSAHRNVRLPTDQLLRQLTQ